MKNFEDFELDVNSVNFSRNAKPQGKSSFICGVAVDEIIDAGKNSVRKSCYTCVTAKCMPNPTVTRNNRYSCTTKLRAQAQNMVRPQARCI